MLLLRLRRFALFFGLFCTVCASGFWGWHSGSFKKAGDWAVRETLIRTAHAGFKVKDILVTGRSRVPADELLSRLGIQKNAPIFGVRIDDAQKSIADMSWVKSVSVARRLPDTIFVEMREREPAALWQYQKKISVIDREGVVLTTDNLDRWQHLPLVVGADAPQHAAQLLDWMAAEPVVAAQLVSASRIGGRRWDLRLQNGLSVRLPERDAELALRQLAAAQEQKNIFNRAITAIDLRQPDRVTVLPETAKQEEPKTSI